MNEEFWTNPNKDRKEDLWNWHVSGNADGGTAAPLRHKEAAVTGSRRQHIKLNRM